jgi:hypothetical protein
VEYRIYLLLPVSDNGQELFLLVGCKVQLFSEHLHVALGITPTLVSGWPF